MNFYNLPDSESDRRTVLFIQKKTLEELLEEFKGDDSVSSFVFGSIHNKIEIIDRCLEFGVDHVRGELND